MKSIFKYLARKKQEKEDKRKEEEARAEMEHAKRVVRGKICHAKIMQRLAAHGDLVRARNKRIAKQKRTAALSGHVWPPVRHAGLVVDESVQA